MRAHSFPKSLIIYFPKALLLGEKFQWTVLKHNISSSWRWELKQPFMSKFMPLIFKTKKMKPSNLGSHSRSWTVAWQEAASEGPSPSSRDTLAQAMTHQKHRRNLRRWFLICQGSLPLLLYSQKKTSILKKQEQLKSQCPSSLWLIKAGGINSLCGWVTDKKKHIAGTAS